MTTAQVLENVGVPFSQVSALAPAVDTNARALQAQKNVRAFSDLIARAEGTLDGPFSKVDPYRVGFGGTEIADLSKHPGKKVAFNELNADGSVGKANLTSAAGKHQWLGKTWDNLSKRSGVKDFGPEAQERNFVELLKDQGVLASVESGDFRRAIDVLGKRQQFASLPTSTAKQPKRSWDQMAAYAKASGIDLGAMVAGTPQPIAPGTVVEAMLPTRTQIAEKVQDDALAQAQEFARQDVRAREEAENLARQEEAARDASIASMLYSASGLEDALKIDPAQNLPKTFDKELRELIRTA